MLSRAKLDPDYIRDMIAQIPVSQGPSSEEIRLMTDVET